MRKITGILVLMTALVACGGDPPDDSVAIPAVSASQTPATSESASPPPTEAPPTEAEPTDDPAVAAASLAAAIPDIGDVIEITEDNDPNNLIGRPGQYDAATFMQDKRLGCTEDDNYRELSVDCGAKIERWASQEDAQGRADDVQRKLKDFGLGAEYDYVRGVLLLRVAGELKPSQANAYEEAFMR